MKARTWIFHTEIFNENAIMNDHTTEDEGHGAVLPRH